VVEQTSGVAVNVNLAASYFDAELIRRS
jgi:hypothetical protein